MNGVAAGPSPFTQTWRRVWGLAIRCVVITAQRYLDVIFIGRSLQRNSWISVKWSLIAVLVITTVVSAYTMQRHWSACKQGKPYGSGIGWVTAILQISAFWETVDKISTHGRPRNHLQEPLLPQGVVPRSVPGSHPHKGSQGENVMRGVRKLAIVNVLQAFWSLCLHVSELTPHLANKKSHGIPFALKASLTFSLLSLAIGVADFVLYIWVLDAFVKENKKLVTIHYVLEMAGRVPAVVIFHLTYSRNHGYWPTLWLIVFDVLTTSILIVCDKSSKEGPGVSSSQSQIRGCGSWFWQRSPLRCFVGCFKCLCSERNMLRQFLYSLVVSCILFSFNIAFFDPGMIYTNINRAFYWIKYVELALMLWFISEASNHDPILRAFPVREIVCYETVISVANAFLVFFWIPRRRKRKDANLTSQAFPSASNVFGVDMMRGDDAFLSPRVDPAAEIDKERPKLLIKMQSIFELLTLISKVDTSTENPRNTRLLLDVLVTELWDQLQPDGSYTEASSWGMGASWQLKLQGEEVICTRAKTATELRGVLLNHGQQIILPKSEKEVRMGRFDGTQIQWRGNSTSSSSESRSETWTRTAGSGKVRRDGLMQIILPQLCLALRWERPLEVEQRPLLNFIITYAKTTCEDMQFVSSFYWMLVCLSQEAHVRDIYEQARLQLVQAIPPNAQEKLLSQQRMLRQHFDLDQTVGKSGGSGAHELRTQKLRRILRLGPSHFERSSRADQILMKEEVSILQGDRIPDENETGGYLPINPSAMYQGVEVEASKVIASKQAPVVLACRLEDAAAEKTMMGRLDSAGESTMGRVESHKRTVTIMYKDGDDLRQDQLILQLMDLMEFVWKESLQKSDFERLRRPKYKVLAVTPSFGYVEFVSDSCNLTDALQEAGGKLGSWLRDHVKLDDEKTKLNFYGSVASACVTSYILGLGDRHLENILIGKQAGQIFHVDFGFVFGEDPKPCAPQVRLPQQVAQALRDLDCYHDCFQLAARAYSALRDYEGLFTKVLEVTAAAGGAGCKKLSKEATPAIAGVRERLRVGEANSYRAQEEFLCEMRESSEGLASELLDKVHAAGLFWR